MVIGGRVQELPLIDTLPGTGEDDMTYSKRVDFVGEETIYRGEAAVGSSESSSVWRIRKIVLAGDGDVTEIWADGVSTFTKQWTQRTSYSYT